MYDFERMDKRLIIFVKIFLLANRLQTTLDSKMEGLTAKQFLVLLVLGSFPEPPTLGQLAKACDSSHQNTKQLVLKLASKGFVQIGPDPGDARAMRISSTQRLEEWKRENERNSGRFIDGMFSCLTPEQVAEFHLSILLLHEQLGNI